MKFNFRRFLLWYLLYYFLIAGALRDLLIWGQTDFFDLTSSIFALTSLLVFFFYALIPYYVLFRYYPDRKWLYCGIGFVLAFVAPMVFRFLIEQVMTRALFDSTNYPLHYGTREYIIDNYFFAIRFITFGTIYYFITYTLYKQKRESDLMASKQDMEMALLKSQINPHFLLNSMNNIYSLVFHKSEAALPAMEKLTDILKYSLYNKKDFESLEKEVATAEKYIELGRLRMAHPIYYHLEIDKELFPIQVPQYLLLPIVENTLKHGDLSDSEIPAHTLIKKDKDELIIESVNKIQYNEKDKVGGIGLENLERRIHLLYNENYTLETSNENSMFRIHIKIPIL